jgi:hypothetical protein
MLGGIVDIDYGNYGTKIMLKRRTKKASRTEVLKTSGRQYLVCKECNNEEVLVSMDVGAVTCGRCVQRMSAPPENRQSAVKSDKPRGWHFKMYFEQNGVVYSKGEIITDKKEIAKLKKMSTATPVVKAKKVVKKTAVKRSGKNARTTK